jgi:hypothetical protein
MDVECEIQRRLLLLQHHAFPSLVAPAAPTVVIVGRGARRSLLAGGPDGVGRVDRLESCRGRPRPSSGRG